MRVGAVLAFGLILGSVQAAGARYTPPSFAGLVFESSAIVVGKIEALRETDYDFRVEERIRGAEGEERLRIRRFEDFACASRAPYAVGQRFIAFLRRGEGGWYSAGGGCEGDVIFAGGATQTTVLPDALWGGGGAIPEERFLGAVRKLTTGYKGIGQPGFAGAWTALLRDAEPLVVATAVEQLDAESDLNPGPASAFADDLLALTTSADRGVRLYVALRVGRLLSGRERAAAASHFDSALRTVPSEQRPAVALARVSMSSSLAERHVTLLRVLSDETIPLEARLDAADAVTSYGANLLGGVSFEPFDAAARETLQSVRDPSLVLAVCKYVERLHGGFVYPRPTDAGAERAKWLSLLASPSKGSSRSYANVVIPADEPFLTAVERAVFVPRDVEDRPKIAKLVRAARRARNAAKAGDKAVALDSYRDLCGAAPYLTVAQRKLLADLGVDIDALTAEARELAKDE